MANDADSGAGYDDTVTIRLDRRRAEDLYYDLLLALGGQDYGQNWVGKNGKSNGKSYVEP